MRTLPLHRFLIALAFATVRAAGVSAQIDSQRTPAPALASLVGVVRDSTGAPMADAEVTTLDQRRTTRTGADGRFTLADIPLGSHDVFFRKLGYTTVSYTWLARANEQTDLMVTLRALPHTLDPVVVRAQEDKKMRGRSAILGFVVDSLGETVADAEVQLVGADRVGLTRENGGFAFRQLPVGSYLVRARKLGYEPNAVAVQLQDGDEREMAIKIRQLPTQLDPVVVNERSGYGRSEAAWAELDKRKRWRSAASDVVIGPDDLRRFGGISLDMAMLYAGVSGAEQFAVMRKAIPTHMEPPAPRVSAPQSQSNIPSRARAMPSVGGQPPAPTQPIGAFDDSDACILINGKELRFTPLRRFMARDVELVEVYPTRSDPGGTLAARFTGVHCREDMGEHPTWYVVWLRDAK